MFYFFHHYFIMNYSVINFVIRKIYNLVVFYLVMVIYSIGHKNPDTDSVCGAIAIADLENQLGNETIPCMQGELNPETKFVLKKFNVSVPKILTDGEGKKLILVDHTEVSQTVNNLGKAEIVGIIDHHKLGDITTSTPLEALIRPLGSTCTIIKQLYNFYDKVIPKEIAGVKDIKKLGMEMFKVKSAIEGTSIKDLVLRDYKDFDMNGHKVGIGQLELIDLSLIEKIKDDLYEEIKRMKGEGRHSVFLLLTDIMKEGTEMLYVTDDSNIIKKAFNKKPEKKSVWLDGVMSRKKQVVPPLEKAFS